MNSRIAEIGRRVLDGDRLSGPDALALVKAALKAPYDLFYWAHQVRTQRFGRAMRFCSIVSGKTGACTEDCKWCAQSAVCRNGPQPSRADLSQIYLAAQQAHKNHAFTIGIVNSGRRPSQRDMDDLVTAAGNIRSQHDIGVCASLGELTDDQAARLAQAGIICYNHNLETSRRFYPTVVSSHNYDDRLRTVAAVRKAGIKVCCGGIFGLGETWEDRIELALTLRDEAQPDVAPLNFLHPIAGTPLERSKPMEPLEILTVVAIFRLVLPGVDLKIAGGRELNLRQMQNWAFYAGATSAIIGNYLTTSGQSPAEDLRMAADSGLQVVQQLSGTSG